MPVYQREPGVFRIVVSAHGKAFERVFRGTRQAAEAAEDRFRAELGAKPRLAAPAAIDPEEATELVWIGGHAGSFVYFVQSGSSGPIKIGFAKNAGVRLRGLQTGSHEKLRLLCAIPGGRALEAALHKAFKDARLDGEWFKPTPALVALTREIASTSKVSKPSRRAAA